MTLDLGTGDGHFVLARAAARPDELVVGVDASHAAMAEASRRAARAVGRGGLPNARFVLSAAEALPSQLSGLASLVTVHFPWGSLLRGAMGAESERAEDVARLVADGGRLRLLLSSASRDAAKGAVEIDPAEVVAAYQRFGFNAVEVRPATVADATAVRSSWGRRILTGRESERRAWLFDLRRDR